MTRPSAALPALVLTVVGVLAGCSGSSTDPIESPLFFTGEVAFMGNSTHNFTVVSEGMLRFEMTRLEEQVAEGGAPLGLDLAIGMGVGRPANGECATRYSVLIREGGIAVLSLAGADFCVSLFDGGSLFPDVIVEYELSVSPG